MLFFLFCNYQIVVFLSFLEKKVLSVEQICIRQRGLRIGQFFFVQTESVRLNHLTRFAFGGEDVTDPTDRYLL